MSAKSLYLCLTLCDPVDCSLPGSFIHGILQARILEWVAISFSTATQGFEPRSPALQADSLPSEPQGKLLCVGRCKWLGSLNSFLSYASQLSGTTSCFLINYILNSSFTIHWRKWMMLWMAATCDSLHPSQLLSAYSGSSRHLPRKWLMAAG